MTYQQTIDRLRKSFVEGKTKPLAYRKAQLNNLLRLHEEGENEIVEALKADLNKPKMESMSFEIDYNRNVIRGTIYDVEKWMQDEYVEKNMLTLLDTTYVHREPFGVAIVLGAWNYPVQLTLAPVAGAIAAGNCVVIKPSELAPKTAETLKKLIEKYMDPDTVTVITGGAQETSDLLSHKFDYIFYTGSPRVGRIIAEKASKHLTPCTLELGGKCPLYIDESVDILLAVKRILWGKCINLGQTCVAPDYILCSKAMRTKLLETIEAVHKEFFGDYNQAKSCPDLCRIINDNHFKRLLGLLSNTRGKIAIQGEVDQESRFIGLTVVTDLEDDDPIMQEEIFGPILPIIIAETPGDAIDFINSKDKPLSLYIFSENKKTRDLIVSNTSSGSVCCNDVIVQLSVETLPFGGIGESGYGSYHGKYSFETFSHRKSILVRNFGFIGEALGKFRYPPYTQANMDRAGTLLKRRHFPSLPSGLGYILAVATGFVLAIATKALLVGSGIKTPDWF